MEVICVVHNEFVQRPGVGIRIGRRAVSALVGKAKRNSPVRDDPMGFNLSITPKQPAPKRVVTARSTDHVPPSRIETKESSKKSTNTSSRSTSRSTRKRKHQDTISCATSTIKQATRIPPPCLVEAVFVDKHEGMVINCLVDTGSQLSFVTRAIAKTLINVAPIHTTGYMGGDPQIIEKATERIFGLNDRPFNHKFYVLKDCPFPCILGWDFLQHYKATVGPNGLIFNDDGHFVPLASPSASRAAGVCLASSRNLDVLDAAVATERDRDKDQEDEFPPPKIGNAEMTPTQRKILDELLEEHAHCFVSPERPIGMACVYHRLHPTGKPFKAKLAKLSPAQQEVQKACIDKMIKYGVVVPSKSEWASRPSFAPKPNGTIRFCLNFRNLNRFVEPDNYPIPRAGELLEPMRTKRYFTSLDAAHGYWQIPIHPDDRKYTAVITHDGLYEFVRMPFGLHNAPAT